MGIRSHTIVWLVLTTAFVSPRAFASGWNDYELQIGDGYSIFRANAFDVSVCHRGRQLIGPEDDNEIGPVCGYAVTNEFIFARAYGMDSQDLFNADAAVEIDRTRQFYFVLQKDADAVTGPLSLAAFERNPIVQEHAPVAWKTPRNPNAIVPLAGAVAFIIIAIPILMMKFYYISLPILVGIVCLIAITWGRRRERGP